MSGMLPNLIGRQKEVVTSPAWGHLVVLGTVGSGKTTLAIQRSAFLSTPTTDNFGKTLLLTFNQCLVGHLESLGAGAGTVDVRTYQQFALEYLESRRKATPGAIAEPELAARLIQRAAEHVPDRPHARLPLLIEEFRWLSHTGIRTFEEYAQAEQDERFGARLPRHERRRAFQTYRAYQNLRLANGFLFDRDDLAHGVLEELQADPTARIYKHVVIDQGQDFSPAMVRSLAAAIPRDGSLTFFGDMAQQLDGHKVSWRTAGLRVIDQDIYRLDVNRRATTPIARLAGAMTESPHYWGLNDLVEPALPLADGPLPAVISFDSEAAEMKFVAGRARKLAEAGSVAVLFRDRDLEQVLPLLVPSTTQLSIDRPWAGARGGIFYGTYDSAKGLEFDSVIVPFVSTSRLPYPPAVEEFGSADAAAHDVRLLYVATTRARTNLIFTHTGVASGLLPLWKSGLVERSHR